MSTSPGSRNALFLSYAHIDNEPLVPGQAGWVENFQYSLRVRLKQLLGGEPGIFWDKATIHGNDILTGVIETDVVRCSVLVPIVSPSYVNSERSQWCRRELETFCAAAERAGGIRIGDKSRIYKVIKTPVPRAQEPDPLRDLIGYEFYATEPATGRVREFSLQSTLGSYLDKIEDLARDITELLEQLKNAADGRTPAPAAKTIYLAETTRDLAGARERVLRSLRQRKYSVLPGRLLPVEDGAALRAYVGECLEHADLSVHLVGASYGAVPEGETESVVVIQNEMAAARSAGGGLPRIIWIAPGSSPADPRQTALVEGLYTNADLLLGADRLSGSLEELETEIQDVLARTTRPTPRVDSETPSAPSALRYVYLICDKGDLDAALTLRDVLYASDPQVEVSLPVFESDNASALHREQLTDCDAVLLYVGSASTSWLEVMRLELRKMNGLPRGRPVAAKGIYLGPPATPDKERFQTREAIVLREFGPPTAAGVQAFVQRLREAPTA